MSKTEPKLVLLLRRGADWKGSFTWNAGASFCAYASASCGEQRMQNASEKGSMKLESEQQKGDLGALTACASSSTVMSRHGGRGREGPRQSGPPTAATVMTKTTASRAAGRWCGAGAQADHQQGTCLGTHFRSGVLEEGDQLRGSEFGGAVVRGQVERWPRTRADAATRGRDGDSRFRDEIKG